YAFFEMHLLPFGYMFAIWILIFYIAGLYDKHTVFFKSLMRARIVVAHTLNVVVAGVLFFALPFAIAPKTTLLIYFVVSSLLILWWRLRLYRVFSPRTVRNALLIADGEEAQELLAEVNRNERYSYRFTRMV